MEAGAESEELCRLMKQYLESYILVLNRPELELIEILIDMIDPTAKGIIPEVMSTVQNNFVLNYGLLDTS